MRIPRIYSKQVLASNTRITLEAAASHYLSRVLRMQAGRELIVFNGEGGEYRAEIVSVTKQNVGIQTYNFTQENRNSGLTTQLAIGISKGDRMDWVLQKACELGVSEITPLFCERSEVKLAGDRLQKKINHWRQVVISACEQCQRNILPELAVPQNTQAFLPSCHSDLKLVLHHRSAQALGNISSALQQAPKSVTLLIGPEGGLDESEIHSALAHQFKALTMGPRVLRTETAPLAAMSLVQYLWGDLNSQ